MKEDIYIDGVNVAGCDFYELCGCIDDNHELNECKDNPNCYYKQLKRLEQKNFALTQESQQKSQTICELEQENKYYKQLLQGCPAEDEDCGFCEIDKRNKELEQENKELKEEIQFHNKENSNLLAERNALQIGYDEIREVRERYRSALEEIREIAENAKEGRYTTKSEDYTEGVHIIGCYVLDKINEVLND